MTLAIAVCEDIVSLGKYTANELMGGFKSRPFPLFGRRDDVFVLILYRVLKALLLHDQAVWISATLLLNQCYRNADLTVHADCL